MALDEAVDNLLTFLHLCRDDRHAFAVSLRSMDGAIPSHDDARSTRADEFLIPRNDGEPAVWPVDTKIVFPTEWMNQPAPERWPAGSMQFHRTRTIRTAEARRFGATLFASKMVQDEAVSAMPDGTTRSGGGPYAFLGKRWIPAAPSQIVYPPNGEVSLWITIGWELAVRYEWTVWIGYETGPRIRFLSDPTGARAVFRLRDIPEGKERRAALRNWVEAHWRHRRDDPDNAAWVRKHLRGTTEFTWNGVRCRIQPPAFDVEQLQARQLTGARS